MHVSTLRAEIKSNKKNKKPHYAKKNPKNAFSIKNKKQTVKTNSNI